MVLLLSLHMRGPPEGATVSTVHLQLSPSVQPSWSCCSVCACAAYLRVLQPATVPVQLSPLCPAQLVLLLCLRMRCIPEGAPTSYSACTAVPLHLAQLVLLLSLRMRGIPEGAPGSYSACTAVTPLSSPAGPAAVCACAAYLRVFLAAAVLVQLSPPLSSPA
jgi:hypothetical protein